MSTATSTSASRTVIDLDVQGMTCASCAARIEKKLNRVDGVHASVNYATEKAHVVAPAGTSASDLVAIVEKAGYGASEPVPDAPEVDHAAQLRTRLVAAIVLSLPVLVVSMVPSWQFAGWQWMCLALSTPVVFGCGLPFHRSALVNARHGATTMDTLVSLGTLAAWLWSVNAMLFGSAGRIGMRHEFTWHVMRMDPTANVYFEAACGVTMFLLLGRYIEARSRRRAGSALSALLRGGVGEVQLVTDADGARVERPVPVSHLAVGDIFRVSPGQTVGTDGVITEGASAVDASLVTGESLPVEVAVGDAVVGGSINTTGALLVRATAVGADTQLARIAHLVEAAQTGKANAQRLADKVSAVFVPVVLGLSLLTLVGWLVTGHGWGMALSSAIAVLIIACPCALGLATPTALLAGTGRGAELGILISGPEALERARDLSTVLLDKTGTLTTGQMSLVGVYPVTGQDADELARVLAGLEGASRHPVARAVVAGLPVAADAVRQPTEVPGRGVRAELPDGSTALAGNARLLQDEGQEVPEELTRLVAEHPGDTQVYVAWGGRVRGLALVSDTPRPGVVAALQALRRQGLQTVLLTGDSFLAARQLRERLAQEAGEDVLDGLLAEVLPEDKLAAVVARQQAGDKVAMVGDGINDAAALAQADLGIAMGEGTDAARAASDVTLLRPDLGLVADAIALSRRTVGTIRANLFWATVYNALAIPLAALGFLTPMIAGAAMACSSVFVVLNSLRLQGFHRIHRR